MSNEWKKAFSTGGFVFAISYFFTTCPLWLCLSLFVWCTVFYVILFRKSFGFQTTSRNYDATKTDKRISELKKAADVLTRHGSIPLKDVAKDACYLLIGICEAAGITIHMHTKNWEVRVSRKDDDKDQREDR